MRVYPVPCLQDNYAYLLSNQAGSEAIVVDPSEAAPVRDALKSKGLKLVGIWLTHHHWDHVGGVDELVDQTPGIDVLGSRYDLAQDRIPKQTRGLSEGDEVFFDGKLGSVLEIPGHTLGAIAYLIDGHLFSGDTLFLAGCGRVFEGTMEMMSKSLLKLRSLPPSTSVWCGHEYTIRNLEFAATVEPENAAIAAALIESRAQRADGVGTVPGLLAREVETNPFLRFDVGSVAQGRDPVQSFTALREAKDRF